ncbi:MAG: PAS domain S-box protein [Bryobacterales bacterium]|nr:PAS domain S-box protein [Bryobacterales bacterium]
MTHDPEGLQYGTGQPPSGAAKELSDILNSAPGAFLHLDPAFRILRLNTAAVELLGITQADAMGRLLWDTACCQPGGEFEARHREAMATRSELCFDHCCSASESWLAVRLLPAADGGLLAWYTDRSADLRAKLELERREREYRAILYAAMDGFWIMDTSGRFLDVNDAYCRLIGHSRQELLGMTVLGVDAGQTEDEIRASIARVMEDGYGRLEVKHRHKDGRVLDLEVSANYLCEAGRFCVFLRDVTERNRVASALRDSEARYRIVAEKMQDVFYRTDLAGTMLMVSPSAGALFGISDAQTLIGKNLLTDQILLESEMGQFFQILATAGEVREHEMHLRIRDGTLLDITTNSRFVFDDAGAPVGVEGVFRDITARKKAERAKEALEAELHQAQKLESLGRLAGGIAHDFNNILTVMNGHCELMLDRASPDDSLRPSLLEVRAAGLRAAALTQQLLAFSRNQLFELAVLDLNSLLAESLRLVQRLLGEDVEVMCDLAPDLGLVLADSGRLHQVLMNLVVNARDAMPQGGRITIATRNVRLESGVVPAGEYVQLEVVDNGSGMDEAVRRRIFDPFFTTKEVGKGTGLGLSTVYGIVRQFDGGIDVESQPGHGTTFRIWLPKSAEAELPAVAPEEELAELAGKETILVVEDQAEVRRLAVTMLQRLGYHVLEASGGEEALEIAMQELQPVHLLLTDVVMPRMTGRELAERWRLVRPEAKVLFMSGFTSDEIQRYGLRGDDLELIWKPFRVKQLAARVREMLDRK